MAFPQHERHLLRKKLCTMLSCMTNDERAWLSSAAGRRITATEIAEHLGVARNTVNKRLADGLTSDDLIQISRSLGINPVDALTELKKLTLDEVYGFLDSDGQLLATAGQEELIVALADTSLTTNQLAEMIAKRTQPPHLDDDEITQADLDLAAPHKAAPDTGDDHDDYA